MKFDVLDAAVAGIPEGVDAGEAVRELQFVLTAALESSAAASDALRVLYSVARDALNDLAAHDRDVADALKDFEKKAFGA
ncbi:hypothetical protein ACFSWE_12190 [Leucobacter albus]|uniref:Uncharacterized protein n=1 Tax=Leucobacter albus TaxID=272210 RepID=A0ABW3TTS6_9MICO